MDEAELIKRVNEQTDTLTKMTQKKRRPTLKSASKHLMTSLNVGGPLFRGPVSAYGGNKRKFVGKHSERGLFGFASLKEKGLKLYSMFLDLLTSCLEKKSVVVMIYFQRYLLQSQRLREHNAVLISSNLRPR